ncbi:hypothetical protein OIU76_000921 [Salix suchowensis]|nr:hypothetical protein OIU76_000921 [Salix suchowensis]
MKHSLRSSIQYSLFAAAPTVASMAWQKFKAHLIMDHGSPCQCFSEDSSFHSHGGRTYTFPMTGAAFSTIRFSNELANVATPVLAVILCRF